MSEEGVIKLGQYCSARNQCVLDPLFIAQYLLAPVNTIINDSLLQWMTGPPTTKQVKVVRVSLKQRAHTIKANIYLNYSLLVELMQVVKTYGCYYDYHFESDEQLTVIKSSTSIDKLKNNKTHLTIAFDSFMTIWLLTLPEKFKEWFQLHDLMKSLMLKQGL